MKYLQTEANSELTLCALSWMSRTCEVFYYFFLKSYYTTERDAKSMELSEHIRAIFFHTLCYDLVKKAFSR